MESYILISWINDFTFCPASIYYHNLYGLTDKTLYSDLPQKKGTEVHSAIDEARYSKSKHFLQGIDICSNQYQIYGRLDLYNKETKTIIERKNHIERVYDGYIFQLYAECLCLREMGHLVEKLELYSYSDNKKYPVSLPEDDPELFEKFQSTLKAMRSFQLRDFHQDNLLKCQGCIYRHICERTDLDL